MHIIIYMYIHNDVTMLIELLSYRNLRTYGAYDDDHPYNPTAHLSRSFNEPGLSTEPAGRWVGWFIFPAALSADSIFSLSYYIVR